MFTEKDMGNAIICNSEFDLWPNAGLTVKKVKLLEVKFPLDNNSWKEAIEYYKKLDKFILIVSENIE